MLHDKEEILLRRKIFGLGDNKSVHLGKKMLLEFVFLGSEFRRKRLGSAHMLQFDLLLGGCSRRCWKNLEDDVPEVELVVVDVDLLPNFYFFWMMVI